MYLPAGAAWTSLASGERFDGGALVEVDAPLDVIAVFARGQALTELAGRLSGLRARAFEACPLLARPETS